MGHRKDKWHHFFSDSEYSSVLLRGTSQKALKLLVFNRKNTASVDSAIFIHISLFFCSWKTNSESKSEMDPCAYSCSFLKLETCFALVTFCRINILLSCSLSFSSLLSKGLYYKFCSVL